jgi:NAD(P)-dependent dehydrogenase (short-subunit alcohol dehydrogenase family)
VVNGQNHHQGLLDENTVGQLWHAFFPPKKGRIDFSFRQAVTGIGRATALAFAREGARVVVSVCHEDEGQKLATEPRNLGTEAKFLRTDVRLEEEVKNLVDKIVVRFGSLDIAVNNAGTVGNPESSADATAENDKAIFDTNALGVLLSMQCEIRAMIRQGKGSIVNTAYGKVGGPSAAAYFGSKHAVGGITKSAAIELAGTGVRVNAVGPGSVETRMFNHFLQTKKNKATFLEAQGPNKRIGTPEEIANAIVFFASDKASYIMASLLQVGSMQSQGTQKGGSPQLRTDHCCF